MNRQKMIKFFAAKGVKDFKNSKQFWKFYSASIRLKSDCFNSVLPTALNNGPDCVNEPEAIGNLFNLFFTTISSNSLSKDDESKNYVFKQFANLKNNNVIRPGNFSFKPISASTVEKQLATISPSSAAGISGIPTKIIHSSSDSFVIILTKLFNKCVNEASIPSDWKIATVTPLYKKKGSNLDMNNYRGISVLVPFVKLFEKILAEQIVDYFSEQNLLFNGQHGFRANHSCESALHEILSDMNKIRDRGLIGLFLFIDFRKAFDLVNSDLLLHKLFHYGFSNQALALIKNYFANRQQLVKIKEFKSTLQPIKLGVPQGSVLGPLFFIIFINDLALSLRAFTCKLFADDTTLYKSGSNFDELKTEFFKDLSQFTDWCKYNKLDINWSKTHFMVVTNKRINKPELLHFDGTDISVVDSFKLLGVTIDNKLNFLEHVAILRHTINKKLFSIKRLFYLSTSVKIQFFKSFILPFFDYCLSIIIYFPRVAIQKLANCFYLSLFKLFKFNYNSHNPIEINNFLEKYGLFSFQHRVILKLFNFSHKIHINCKSPSGLSSQFIKNSSLNKNYSLRNKDKYFIPRIKTHYGEATFAYFFSTLFNKFLNDDDFEIKTKFFSHRIFNNINLIFNDFVLLFPKFSINIIHLINL
jgi:hypothetical protein